MNVAEVGFPGRVDMTGASPVTTILCATAWLVTIHTFYYHKNFTILCEFSYTFLL